MMKALLLGMVLLVLVAAWQSYQQRQPAEFHNTIASQSIATPDNVRQPPVEVHHKIARREQHSLAQKLRELFLGQEETVIWGHPILIKSCRNAVKQTINDNGPLDSHHVIKCGATKVEIISEELRVNEKSYGKLAEKVPVQVKGSKVFINDIEVQPVAQVAQQ